VPTRRPAASGRGESRHVVGQRPDLPTHPAPAAQEFGLDLAEHASTISHTVGLPIVPEGAPIHERSTGIGGRDEADIGNVLSARPRGEELGDLDLGDDRGAREEFDPGATRPLG